MNRFEEQIDLASIQLLSTSNNVQPLSTSNQTIATVSNGRLRVKMEPSDRRHSPNKSILSTWDCNRFQAPIREKDESDLNEPMPERKRRTTSANTESHANASKRNRSDEARCHTTAIQQSMGATITKIDGTTGSKDEAANDRFNSSSSRTESKKDPFSAECRIPLPGMLNGSGYIGPDSRSFVRKRNERERTRVRNVNDGFERLRNRLPAHAHVLLGCSSCGISSIDRPHTQPQGATLPAYIDGRTDFLGYFAGFDADGSLIGSTACSGCGAEAEAEPEMINGGKDRRLSKVETLRLAIAYIKHLQKMLQDCSFV